MNSNPGQAALDEALRLTAAGDFVAAFNAYVMLIDGGGAPPAAPPAFAWFLVKHMPGADHPTVHKAIELALTRCWIRPEALVPVVARQLAARYPRAMADDCAPGEPQLVQLLTDPLLIALLGATPAATPQLDILLARFRHAVLRRVIAGKEVAELLPTLAALAVRGFHGGYALTLPASARHRQDLQEEPALVEALAQHLAERIDLGAGYAAMLATLACYRAPGDAELQPGLAAGNGIAGLLEKHVTAPAARRAAHMASVPALTPVDATSGPVAEQYEAHPYPAWTCEPADPVLVPDGVVAAVGGSDAVASVLVAGCGTGQQAVAAVRTWPAAEVLAVDLSRASLAYAMERAAGESRLTFGQADLLQLAETGRRFRVVEAMGVLHHLADPEAGLQALARLTEPGGVMGIGLYSANVRRQLVALGERYGNEARTDAEVRAFRAWALAEAGGDPFLRSADFYSIGGCRDAVFNVRERGYEIAEIAPMLARAGLRLIALQPPPLAYDRLASLPALDDLAGWAQAERAHPDLFASMIELWVQPLAA